MVLKWKGVKNGTSPLPTDYEEYRKARDCEIKVRKNISFLHSSVFSFFSFWIKKTTIRKIEVYVPKTSLDLPCLGIERGREEGREEGRERERTD